MSGSRLVVTVDGRTLSDDEARVVWTRFSAHMGEHQGDFAGFAKKEGYASAAAESRGGKAVLALSTSPGASPAPARAPAPAKPGKSKRRKPGR